MQSTKMFVEETEFKLFDQKQMCQSITQQVHGQSAPPYIGKINHLPRTRQQRLQTQD